MGETKYWGQKIPRYKTENMILFLNCKTKKYGALQILDAYAKMNDAPTIFHLYFFFKIQNNFSPCVMLNVYTFEILTVNR